MDVLQIGTSTEICEVAHDTELSLMRVRFHRNGRARADYYEFANVPRGVFDEFRRIEDDARHAGISLRKVEVQQSVARYYHRTLRVLFDGVRVMPGGDCVRLV